MEVFPTGPLRAVMESLLLRYTAAGKSRVAPQARSTTVSAQEEALFWAIKDAVAAYNSVQQAAGGEQL